MKKHTVLTHILVCLLMIGMLTGCTSNPVVTEFTPATEHTVMSEISTEAVPETTVSEPSEEAPADTTAAATNPVQTTAPDAPTEQAPHQTQFHTYELWNNNIPVFTDDAKSNTSSYENYSPLDELGRCGPAMANIGIDIMPTEERGSIGQVKPTGWHTVKYDIVDGKYLYNRCHLIGYQLTGENANRENLVTGTRFLNVDGMLPFENLIADYIETHPHNHVLYRVTPMFYKDELVCRGIVMEAFSVEDHGRGVQFAIYCPNVQPGIEIDYATGDSWENSEIIVTDFDGNILTDTSTDWGNTSTDTSTDNDIIIKKDSDDAETQLFILNTNSGKFHLPDCQHVKRMKPENSQEVNAAYDDMIADGYSPCKSCLG